MVIMGPICFLKIYQWKQNLELLTNQKMRRRRKEKSKIKSDCICLSCDFKMHIYIEPYNI